MAAFLTAALFAMLLYSRQRSEWSNWLIGGGLTGLLTLTRPSLVPLGVLLWIVVAFRANGKGRRTGPCFFVTDRFRLPLAPVLALSAAYGLAFLWREIKDRKWVKAGGCVAAGCLTYFFLGRPAAESSPASFYLSAGEVYYRDGDYDRALSCLRKLNRISEAKAEWRKCPPSLRRRLERESPD